MHWKVLENNEHRWEVSKNVKKHWSVWKALKSIGNYCSNNHVPFNCKSKGEKQKYTIITTWAGMLIIFSQMAMVQKYTKRWKNIEKYWKVLNNIEHLWKAWYLLEACSFVNIKQQRVFPRSRLLSWSIPRSIPKVYPEVYPERLGRNMATKPWYLLIFVGICW